MPHFTTIAHFVSTLGDDIARVFAAVVAIGDAQGLIAREMGRARRGEAAEQCVEAAEWGPRRL